VGAQTFPNSISVGSYAVNVIINEVGSFFNNTNLRFVSDVPEVFAILSNTDRFRVFTLLHELAHSMHAPGFGPDIGSNSSQLGNNRLLWENCSTTINRASNLR
jgi:hypothetical protein